MRISDPCLYIEIIKKRKINEYSFFVFEELKLQL